MTRKKILAFVAHPDDESFAIGGTLAKYARSGHEIHVVCATRGESGEGGENLALVRERELREASRILGVKQIHFLDYLDGTLCNNVYHEMAAKIEALIKKIEPDVVISFELLGVSGHIDHIALALVTTFVCRKYQNELKLFYYCELKEFAEKRSDYFIYFPPGYALSDIDTVIDTEAVWNTKVSAMQKHKTQTKDVQQILSLKKDAPKREYFIQAFRTKSTGSKRNDFFAT